MRKDRKTNFDLLKISIVRQADNPNCPSMKSQTQGAKPGLRLGIRPFKTSFQSLDAQKFQPHEENMRSIGTKRANPFFPFFVPSLCPCSEAK